MKNPPFILEENEEIVKRSCGHYFPSSPAGISVHILSGDVVLTNNRILFYKDLNYGITEFPLSKIINVARRYLPTRGRYNTLSIDFENGGSEFFSVDKVDEWIDTINSIKDNAPERDYVTKPFISGTDLIKKMTEFEARIIVIAILALFVIIIAITFLISIIQSN